MAWTFQDLGVPNAIYDLMLALPVIGVAMLAPSTVLTLLNMTSNEDQAVANGGLIMCRSLGVFVSTALSTTVLQNVFLLSVQKQRFGADEAKTIESVRQHAELLPSVQEPLRSQIIKSYEVAFTAAFGLCLAATLLILVTLLRVKVGGFRK